MNSRSATATPARSAIATPSPVDSGGFVVTAKHCPAPPVAIDGVRGAQDALGPVGSRRAMTPVALPFSTRRSVASHPSWTSAPDCCTATDKRPFDLGAGRVAACVDDPRHRVAALARERERSVDASRSARRAP